jgi:hypothetical protein
MPCQASAARGARPGGPSRLLLPQRLQAVGGLSPAEGPSPLQLLHRGALRAQAAAGAAAGMPGGRRCGVGAAVAAAARGRACGHGCR